jgi:hypothetical protein
LPVAVVVDGGMLVEVAEQADLGLQQELPDKILWQNQCYLFSRAVHTLLLLEQAEQVKVRDKIHLLIL